MGPTEVTRLQTDPLLWIEDDADGNPVVKSRIPPCRFCNRLSPHTFPLNAHRFGMNGRCGGICAISVNRMEPTMCLKNVGSSETVPK